MQQTASTTSNSSSRGLFGTNIPASLAFLVGVLLFLLPFAQVRCNNTILANNTGLGIAMGSEWKPFEEKNSLDNNSAKDYQGEKPDPNLFAIASLALGVIGFIVVLLNFKRSGTGGLLIGLLAAAALLGMLFDLKSQANDKPSAHPVQTNLLDVKVSVDGTPWFYITVVVFLLAAFFSWQYSKART